MDYKAKYNAYKNSYDGVDYRTGTVRGSDIFDTSRSSGYDQYIPGSGDEDLIKREENKVGKIVMMSPAQYFKGCVDIFNKQGHSTTLQKQIDHIRDYEQYQIDYLKEVILKYKKQFPMTYLDYATPTQEGRHRMYAAGEIFGWDKKFPVLVVDWADPERAERDKQEKYDREITKKVEDAIKDVYEVPFVSWDDVAEELEFDLENLKYKLEEDDFGNVVYDIEVQEDEDRAVITFMNKYKITVDGEMIKWISQEEKDRRDKEFDDEINSAVDDLDNLPDDILLDDDFFNSYFFKN